MLCLESDLASGCFKSQTHVSSVTQVKFEYLYITYGKIKVFIGIALGLYRGMTIKVGTIQELTGQGYEMLVDYETRQNVIAKFFDGKMVSSHNENELKVSPQMAQERTVITA